MTGVQTCALPIYGNFSDGLARHIPLLGARGSERRKRGTKHQQRLLKKTIGSRHDRDLDSAPHCIQYPGEVSSSFRYERETLIDQKPFADSLTEELTNKISRIPRTASCSVVLFQRQTMAAFAWDPQITIPACRLGTRCEREQVRHPGCGD